MYLKQGGEYRLLPFKLPKKALCDFVNEDIYFLPKAVNVTDITFPVSCPLETVKWFSNLIENFCWISISQKTYEINGYLLELEDAMVGIVSSGDYAGEGIIWKDEKEMFKWRAYVSIIKI